MKPIDHTKSSNYPSHKCRCELCRSAYNKRQRARVLSLIENYQYDENASDHGTQREYARGCRCDRCAVANTWYCREGRWRRTHHVEPEAIYALLVECENRCSICQEPFENDNFQVDHCHTSGKVRGLLCQPCNMGLGSFKDATKNLLNAVEYLARTTS